MEELHTKKDADKERFSSKETNDYYVEGYTPEPIDPVEPSTKPSKPKWLAYLVNILLALWQLPQNLIGVFTALFTGWHYVGVVGGAMFFTKKGTGCVSLGQFVFVTSRGFLYDKELCAHEWGHTRQSRMLGWLYLFVIGIPSAVKCTFCNDSEEYHEFYTEAWADRLGKRFPTDEYKEVVEKYKQRIL